MEFIKEAGVSPQKSMDIKNDKITIKPLRDKDVDIFSKWLAKEYIYKSVSYTHLTLPTKLEV